MKIFTSAFLVLIIIAALPLIGLCKETVPDEKQEAIEAEAKAKVDLAVLEGRSKKFSADVNRLYETYQQEVNERDRLMLQRRFVKGKQFYFMLGEYREAAEIFWGIVLHPEAQKFHKFDDALYYLAESLFQLGYYYDAKEQYDRLMAKGADGQYYILSLLRLIEISIARKEYNQAETYYARLISDLPPDQDGSLGLYLIGKSHFIRGNFGKGIEVLESIPEDKKYFGMAQYYLAAVAVKQKKYDPAMDRLRKLKGALKNKEYANYETVFALTHLALGRMNYDANDFPQAMTTYFAVPAESPQYPEALYESLWVFTTRNDFLLQAIAEEDETYNTIVHDYSFVSHSLDMEEDKEAVANLVVNVDNLGPELTEMQDMFNKFDDSLMRLQKEAVTSFEKLVKSAPGSPLIPEAELLLGGIYSQVHNYDEAEKWYRNAQNKYTNFVIKVNQAQDNFLDDQTAIMAVYAGNTPKDQPKPNTSGMGIPPDVAYWLAADKEVKEVFALYEMTLQERKNIQYMQQLVGDIESELRKLDSGNAFPFYKEAYRKVYSLRAEAGNIEGLVGKVSAEAQNIKDDETRQEMTAKLPGFTSLIQNGKGKLSEVNSRIEQLKREKMASYRQEVQTLAAPLREYTSHIDTLYAQAGNMTAQTARLELREIERSLHDYITQAELGLVDTGWKATEQSQRDIKRLQRKMEDEIRQFRRSLESGQ